MKDLKLVEKISTQYNIGHLVAAEGDTVAPKGKYLVAMNKWAMDRFNSVGPLLPQNLQLIDLTGRPTAGRCSCSTTCRSAWASRTTRRSSRRTRSRPGTSTSRWALDAITKEKSPFTVEGGKERVERKGNAVDVYMTAIRSHFTPDVVRVKEGDKVRIHLTNLEQAHDATHGFAVNSYNINASLEPGKHTEIEFIADRPGVFPMYCTEFCSALHLEMAGYFLVEPKKK